MRLALPALAILEGLSWRQSLILAGLAGVPGAPQPHDFRLIYAASEAPPRQTVAT